MKETYRQADIKVLQQMISMGYDPSSVINDYEKISVFSEALKESGSSETAAAAYHNEVTAIVLAEAQKEGRAQQEKVMTMFRSLREANEQKYSETGKSEAFERFQDGQIVVAILRNHFPPFAAYYTLRDVAGYSKKTAFQMLQSAGIVKLLYADIQNSTIERQEECRNEMALYRYLAKERMMQSGLKTFDFEDDLAIARRMHELHLPRELIENAVRRSSPVMREIGRDAEKYWAAMAADVSSYKGLPGNVTSYKTLFELGYTAAAVYKAVLGEHIKLNPSLAQHLYEPFVDKDVAETFLTKYKDVDRESLLGVLNDTLRAILMKDPGLPEEKHYGESVLRAVEQRIADFKKQE